MVCTFGGKTIDTIKGAMCLRLRSALLLGMTTRKVPNRRLFYVEYELELSNEYVRQYQSFVRFIEDNIIYLDGFG